MMPEYLDGAINLTPVTREEFLMILTNTSNSLGNLAITSGITARVLQYQSKRMRLPGRYGEDEFPPGKLFLVIVCGEPRTCDVRIFDSNELDAGVGVRRWGFSHPKP
jgi:hypothetical protein